MPKQSARETKLARAALALAAKKPWQNVTLDQIVSSAKLPPKEIKKKYKNAEELLPVIVKLIDTETAARVRIRDRKAPTHDRLFEVMMARFDSLQSHRKGIVSIMKAAKTNPSIIAIIFRSLMTSMQHMLRLAHMERKGTRGNLQQIGLFSIYHMALWRWKNDPTPDLARTMPIIDRTIRLGSKIMHHLDK